MKDECKLLLKHEEAVNVVKFTEDGNYCMTGSDDRTVQLWNPHRPDPSKQLDNPSEVPQALHIKSYSGSHGYPVHDIAIAKDNGKFASVGGDRTAFLTDVATGRTIRRFQAHQHRINAVALTEGCSVMITASYDKTMSIWDLKSNNSREAIQTLSEFTDSVTSIALTESAMLAGCVDGKLRTYDLRTGLVHADDLYEPITSIRLSNDKKSVLCTTLGGILRLIDLKSGQQMKTYTGHKHDQFKLEACIASDDLQVVSGSEDGSIYHWNLTSGEVVCRTELAHRGPITSLCYHPTKPIFVTSSQDRLVKCWESFVLS